MPNPEVSTTECIKVHYRPFRCLLPVNAGEVKTGDLLEMPHVILYYKEDEKTPTTGVEVLDTED